MMMRIFNLDILLILRLVLEIPHQTNKHSVLFGSFPKCFHDFFIERNSIFTAIHKVETNYKLQDAFKRKRRQNNQCRCVQQSHKNYNFLSDIVDQATNRKNSKKKKKKEKKKI